MARRYAPRMPAAERREQLLDATLDLIAEHGYAGVSMEAVARAAGVTKPVVYDAFGGRGALLRALLEREEERALAQVIEALPRDLDGSVRDFVEAGMNAIFASIASRPEAWRLILMPADGTPGEVRAHVDAGRATVRERIEAALAGLASAGRAPAELDTELAAHAVLALGEHGARLVLTDPGRFAPSRVGGFIAAGLSAALEP